MEATFKNYLGTGSNAMRRLTESSHFPSSIVSETSAKEKDGAYLVKVSADLRRPISEPDYEFIVGNLR